jgi:hypothetical protein
MTGRAAVRALAAALLLASVGVLPHGVAAEDAVAPGVRVVAQNDATTAQSSLTVTVVADANGQSPGGAIESARVVVTLPGGQEVQGVTNTAGKVRFDGIAYGAVKVQVLKTGWETAGTALDLASPTQTLQVTLKPDVPPAQ